MGANEEVKCSSSSKSKRKSWDNTPLWGFQIFSKIWWMEIWITVQVPVPLQPDTVVTTIVLAVGLHAPVTATVPARHPLHGYLDCSFTRYTSAGEGGGRRCRITQTGVGLHPSGSGPVLLPSKESSHLLQAGLKFLPRKYFGLYPIIGSVQILQITSGSNDEGPDTGGVIVTKLATSLLNFFYSFIFSLFASPRSIFQAFTSALCSLIIATFSEFQFGVTKFLVCLLGDLSDNLSSIQTFYFRTTFINSSLKNFDFSFYFFDIGSPLPWVSSLTSWH